MTKAGLDSHRLKYLEPIGKVIRSVQRTIDPRRLALFCTPVLFSAQEMDGSDNLRGGKLSLRSTGEVDRMCRNNESSVRKQTDFKEFKEDTTWYF